MRRSFQGSSACESRNGYSTSRGESGAARRTRALRWVALGALVLLMAGCSGGGGSVVRVSPTEAGNQALAEYDTNKDGALDANELKACQGLLAGLKKIDKNNDGRLTADEISDRLAYFQQQGMSMSVSVELTLDGKPLDGATVTLVPEKFMGEATKPAKAVTDEAGIGVFQAEGGDTSVAPGYYRAQVSKNVNGKELVAPRFNTQSVSGYEIVPVAEGRGSTYTLKLKVSSR